MGTLNNEVDLKGMTKKKDREIKIKFNADRSSSFQWNFRPEQSEIIVSTLIPRQLSCLWLLLVTQNGSNLFL